MRTKGILHFDWEVDTLSEKRLMPYAEIGASLSTIAVLVYCCGFFLVVLLFKFGCTQMLLADDNYFPSIITLLQYYVLPTTN